MIPCGIVLPFVATRNMFFLASFTAFSTDGGTSLALPKPTPTCPRPSPTTTSAEKLKRRPPFTTVAQRLILTTCSVSSADRSPSSAPRRPPSCSRPRPIVVCRSFATRIPRLDLQTLGARSVGERLQPAVELEPGAVEHGF